MAGSRVLVALLVVSLLVEPRLAAATPSREQDATARFIEGDRLCDGPRGAALRASDAPCVDPAAAAPCYRAAARGYIEAARAAGDDRTYRRLLGRAMDALSAAVKTGGGEAARELCPPLLRASDVREESPLADADRRRLGVLCPAPTELAPPISDEVTSVASAEPASLGSRTMVPGTPRISAPVVRAASAPGVERPTPGPTPPPGRRARIGLGAGLGAASFVAVASGAIRAGLDSGEIRDANAMLGPTTDVRAETAYFSHANDARSAQFGLIAAGAGLLLSVPSAVVRDVKLWRPIAGCTAALGAGATVFGALMVRSRRRAAAETFDAEPGAGDEWRDAEFFAGPRRSQIAAAVALGAGVGLLLGSLLALAVRGGLHRRERRDGRAPRLGVTGPGLGLSGDF